ncbi:MAG: YIP1 family protein [Bacilli bacterium]|nr:YIP1 family protein [Bacilli bacterium]
MRNKKFIKKLFIIVLMFIITATFSIVKTGARNELNSSPYNTYAVGLDGELSISPLAYEGVNVISFDMVNPQDIYLDSNDIVYIADRGAKVVFRYDQQAKVVTKIGEGVFSGPNGITMDKDGCLYVADYEGKCVYKLDNGYNVIKKYERPTEALFGEESQFRPTKVVVDHNGNLYITSDGNANGIIQLNNEGEFMGYFGPNNVNLTVELFLRRMMLSKEDRETYASLSPKATTNLAIDNKNIVYTVIEGESGVSLKKYNISGSNVLAKDGFFSNSYQDITVDENGFIYTVDTSSEGVIQVMDSDGTLLFCFGSTKTGSLMLGEFDKATGVEVDSKSNIWVLDGGGKNIQIFRKTAFAQTVINAIMAYNEGRYDDATIYYEEIIRQNASFVSAYVGLGKINQRLENYDLAMKYFKLSNYKAGYSEVYWEIRDNWFNHNLVWIIIVIIVIAVLNIFKVWGKLWNLTHIDLSGVKEKINNIRFVQELKYLLKILKKPADVFYDIKYGLKVRQRTAWVVFLVFIIINIIGDYFVRGYLFRTVDTSNVNFAFELLRWGLIILLCVIGNFLISTLQSGEGFFRDIFIGTIFSFAPIILFKIPVDIISNFLTYNEGYIYKILNAALWIWSIINLILMIKEIHNYKLGEFILNVVLTFVAVIIMVLLYLVLYILAMQLIQFIIGLISEGGYR